MSKKAIHTAAEKGDVQRIESALKGSFFVKPAHVDDVDDVGNTALNCAAGNGKLEAVKYLVTKGASIEKGNNLAWTPLHTACVNGHWEVAAFLLDQQASVNKADLNGFTALMHTARTGHYACAKLLMERKADTTCTATGGGDKGKTAFEIATELQHANVAELLSAAPVVRLPG